MSADKSFVAKKARNDVTKDLGKGQNQVKCEETAIRHSQITRPITQPSIYCVPYIAKLCLLNHHHFPKLYSSLSGSRWCKRNSLHSSLITLGIYVQDYIIEMWLKKKKWVYKVKQKVKGFVEGEIGCKGVSIKRWFRW